MCSGTLCLAAASARLVRAGCGTVSSASDSLRAAVACKLSEPEETAQKSALTSREEAAAKHNVPEHKVRTAISLNQKAPEVADQVLAGEKSLNQARRAVEPKKHKAGTSDKCPPKAPPATGDGTDNVNTLVIKKTTGVKTLAGQLLDFLGKDKAVGLCKALHKACSGPQNTAPTVPQGPAKPVPRGRRGAPGLPVSTVSTA